MAKDSSFWVFFLLIFLLSIPFWVIGSTELPLPIRLPASAFIFVNPALAALFLSYRQYGSIGPRELLQKAVDYRVIKNKLWYIPIFLLTPSIYFLSYIILRLASLPLPDAIEIRFDLLPVFSLMFFVSGLLEELGWSGYAIEPMQNRWGVLKASIILGAVWQIWHIVGDVQLHHAAIWIMWHSLYSIGLRVLIVWIYNNTGKSILAATLIHATDNISWALFPNYGSHYDPFITCIITIALTAVVIFLWNPGMLTQDK